MNRTKNKNLRNILKTQRILKIYIKTKNSLRKNKHKKYMNKILKNIQKNKKILKNIQKNHQKLQIITYSYKLIINNSR
jgi:hypothetical protein